MRQVKSANKKPNINCLVLGVVFVVLLSASSIFSQAPGSSTSDPSLAVSQPAAPDTNKEPNLRIEKVPVAGGAEIMTIFAKIRQSKKEIPMVSVLRDTLGDDKPENDQLRYLWMLTYKKVHWTKSWRRSSRSFTHVLRIIRTPVAGHPGLLLISADQTNNFGTRSYGSHLLRALLTRSAWLPGLRFCNTGKIRTTIGGQLLPRLCPCYRYTSP